MLLVLSLAIGILTLHSSSTVLLFAQITAFIAVGIQVYYLAPYIGLFTTSVIAAHKPIDILSVNVYQENTNYKALINLIDERQPDIILVIEVDEKWSQGLSEIESVYKNFKKIPLDNTYGMSFYTRLETTKIKVHYLLCDDRPTIEAHVKDTNNENFIFFGIHPPPPSPTEEPNSAKKDSELMMIAKKVRTFEIPVIVAGDFNNVCWSRISQFFAKVSGLLDARKKRGFYSTFPAHLFLLRFPIDLLYHSKDITVHHIEVLNSIGSDHLPLYAQFTIGANIPANPPPLDDELKKEVHDIIDEGIAEEHKET